MNENYRQSVDQVTGAFRACPEVEAVLLAGSLTSESADGDSDIDLYLYLSAELPAARRSQIINAMASSSEVDNRFWETEDCFILRSTGIKVELMYRTLSWMRDQLERIVDRCEASVGYSTCFVHNFSTSQILYDRSGSLEALQREYRRPYPEALRAAVIAKNLPLLKSCSSSYYNQIALAVKRQDWISVNHRIAALLASYFDILFAVNRLWHPGEKKLLRIAVRDCKVLPLNFEAHLAACLSSSTSPQILAALDNLIEGLENLVE